MTLAARALALILVLVLGTAAYIRLAPGDPARWHVATQAIADEDFANGVRRVIAPGPGALERLDRIIRATPRTRVLAGSLPEGRITYVTRSRLWGFPDYTTVEQDGGILRLHARSRFGNSDLGVNRERADSWIAVLQAGG